MINLTEETKSQLIIVLRTIGNVKCLQKAVALENQQDPIVSLNLRDLSLSPSNIEVIVDCLKEANGPLASISFSYNSALGDLGAVALSKSLSSHVSEIGLVNCGIGDLGGFAVLNWMKNATQLRMICIEQNDFSEQLKSKFRQFSNDHPHVLVVV